MMTCRRRLIASISQADVLPRSESLMSHCCSWVSIQQGRGWDGGGGRGFQKKKKKNSQRTYEFTTQAARPASLCGQCSGISDMLSLKIVFHTRYTPVISTSLQWDLTYDKEKEREKQRNSDDDKRDGEKKKKEEKKTQQYRSTGPPIYDIHRKEQKY